MHFLFFEDLKADTKGELKKINDFIGVGLSEQQLNNVMKTSAYILFALLVMKTSAYIYILFALLVMKTNAYILFPLLVIKTNAYIGIYIYIYIYCLHYL